MAIVYPDSRRAGSDPVGSGGHVMIDQNNEERQMNRWIRETGRALCALLLVTALIAQSVLPVYADTADRKYAEDRKYAAAVPPREARTRGTVPASAARTSAAAGEEVWVSGTWENGTTYSLDYFDRIAVSSVRGFLTIRTGEDFSIWLPDGWEEAPGYSVQDSILVVSGKKSGDAGPEKSSGEAVVIGEDEPGAGKGAQSRGSGKAGSAAEGRSNTDGSAAGSAEEAAVLHEIVITIPAGAGLDTLRVAMENGDLVLTDITAASATIQTGGGNLILRDVSLGSVDIYTEAGVVSMADSSFGSLNIGMGEGEVSVSSDDGLGECRMELWTGDGTVTLNGSPEGDQYTQSGNGKRSLTVQVMSGDIRIDG